mgnify:CR=1 FL=1
MLLRIVRMEFHADKLDDFRHLFDEVQSKISGFPGCQHVEMCTDPDLENVRYTFSKWDDQAALDAYRHSELFDETWRRTKVLFAGKPQAFSLIQG